MLWKILDTDFQSLESITSVIFLLSAMIKAMQKQMILRRWIKKPREFWKPEQQGNQSSPHHLKIIRGDFETFHINMVINKNNSLGFKFFLLNSWPIKSKTAGTKAFRIYNTVSGGNFIAWIFVQSISHIAAEITMRDEAYRRIDFFRKFHILTLADFSVSLK